METIGNVNAAFSMADENINEINSYKIEMNHNFAMVLIGKPEHFTPAFYNAKMAWKNMKNLVSQVDLGLFNEIERDIKELDTKLKIKHIYLYHPEEQRELMDILEALTDNVIKAIDALGLGIRIKIREKK